MVSAMKLVLFLALVFGCSLAIAQQPSPQIGLPVAQQGGKIKTIPPPGISVPDADQKALRSSLTRLNARIDALRSNPRWPDIAIFTKAVTYALDGNEFFSAEEIFRAKELLRLATE